jgi:hypothetical protein
LSFKGYFDYTPPGPFDTYVPDFGKNGLRDGVGNGKQLKFVKQGNYFDKELKRIFVGEVLPELSRSKSKKKNKAVKKPCEQFHYLLIWSGLFIILYCYYITFE